MEGVWEDETSARAEGRPPRRYYEFTAAGEAATEEALARFPVLGGLFRERPDPGRA